jgi:uncharacterized membrane protein
MLNPDAARKRKELVLVPILLLCAAKGVLWAVLMPPLQCPDELAHFTYVQFLAEEGRLPPAGPLYQVPPEVDDFRKRVRFDEVAFHPEVRYKPDTKHARRLPRGPGNGNSSVAGYPPGYYAVAALAYRAVWSASIEARFYAARLTSVLLGLVTVAAAWALGRFLMPASSSFAIALALLVGLQPMASMLSAAVNNDALLIPVSAVTILLALRCEPGSASTREFLVLGSAIGAGLLAKPQAAFVGLFVALLLTGRALRAGVPARRWVRGLLLTGLGVVVVSGWWAVLAWRRFGSVLGAMGAPPQMGTLSSSWPAFLEANVFSGRALSRAFHLWVKTYWADFGWLDTHFGSLLPYLAIAMLIVLAAVGILRAFTRREAPERRILGMLLAFVLTNVVFLYAVEAVYISQYHAPMLQGRYLFTALLPASALLLVGWRSLAPERARSFVDGAAVLGILVLHVASLLLVMERYYGIVVV